MQGGFKPSTSVGTRVAGPGASAIKYDILTALLATSARGDAVEARLALRLSLVITARFNWRLGTFAVGQRELARMWGVTERTAKREIAAMRARRWMRIDVPAARGRVATHRLDLSAILDSTRPHWDAVGPDFAARMAGVPEPEASTNVVPIRTGDTSMPEVDEFGWHQAAMALRAQDPAVYEAWFSPLRPLEVDAGILTLLAPTQFVADYVRTHFKTRLIATVSAQNKGIREIALVSG